MITFDFSGRTVLVTGAAQGIGKGLAELFATSGARVAALDLDAGALDAAWSGSGAGGDVRTFAVDIVDPAAVDRVVAEVIEWAGLDVVVNNAGITRDGISWKLTDDQWRSVLDVHLTGAFNVTRAALPHLRGQGWGRIVNVTSYTGLHGNVGQANYGAAKAGVIGFTKTVAKEVARSGVTVNAISPNAATAMVTAIPEAKRAELQSAIPMGRYAEPEEIAPAVAFLATDEARYITGAVLTVDGGMSM